MGAELEAALNVIYSLTFIIATSLVSVLWYKMGLPGVKTFVALEFGVAFYGFATLMELNSAALDLKTFWNNIEVVSIGIILATFPLFAVIYAGLRSRRTFYWLVPIWAFLAITLLLVWTNPLHHLYYRSLEIEESLGLSILRKEYGIWAIGTVAVSYVAEMVSAVLIFRASFKWTAQKRQQSLVLGLAFIIPPVLSAFYIFLGIQFIDLVLVGFLLSGIVVFVGLYQFNLFELMPVAEDQIYQSMEDAILVSDVGGTIQQANPSAVALIDKTTNEVIGRTISEYMGAAGLHPQEDTTRRWEMEAEADTPIGRRTLDVRMSPIDIPRKGIKGNLIIIRDMTSKRRAEAQVRIADEKLRILDSVTRHDILNQSMAIAGYASLLNEEAKDQTERRYIEGILRSTDSIREECNFAKSYIDMGVQTPLWQRLDLVVINASSSLSFREAKLDRHLDGFEIYADPLLETVFHNLFDNSLRHGEKLTRISVSVSRRPEDWQVIVEDDGVGIQEELKERIFEEGFGKNTGLGLHLCRRILAITGISLKEEGRSGEGARFVMTVPSDGLRNGGMR